MTGNRLDDPDLHPLDREEAAALLAQLSQRAGVVRRRRAIARIAGTVLPVLVVGGVLAWAVTSLVHLGHASQGPAGGSTTRRTSNPPPAVRAGDVIVFARASGEQIDATGDLWVIGVDGAGETKITDDPGDDTF